MPTYPTSPRQFAGPLPLVVVGCLAVVATVVTALLAMPVLTVVPALIGLACLVALARDARAKAVATEWTTSIQAVGERVRSTDSSLVVSTLEREAANLIGARRALVLLPAEAGTSNDDEPFAVLAAAVLAGGGAEVVTRDGDPRLEAAGVRDALVVPLDLGGGPPGALVTVDHGSTSDPRVPDSEDLAVLGAVAGQAAAAMRDAREVRSSRAAARRDALTGLGNHVAVTESLLAVLADHTAFGTGSNGAALIVLDLVHFAEVNDSLGHVCGDAVLVEVASRLRATAPADALVARLGSDDFAIVAPRHDGLAAHRLASALTREVGRSIAVHDLLLDVGATAGVVLLPEHGEDPLLLLQHGEAAARAARDRDLSVMTYGLSLDEGGRRRAALVGQLRRGIEAGQLLLHYQPKTSLADGHVTGVEALVRWDHPDHGLVSPDEFVPVAETGGLVGALTAYVLNAALVQCRTWLDSGWTIGVAVNVSVRGLHDPTFADDVARALEVSRVPAELLTLEITESSVMTDPDRTLPVLTRLADMGVTLSVDDFGTGYSSLAYLRRLPVSEVKIDKSFVTNMVTDENDAAIVRAVIDLAGSLGLRVVAEGVEDELSRDALRDLGCHVAQGYLFSRPLAADKLATWLVARGGTADGATDEAAVTPLRTAARA